MHVWMLQTGESWPLDRGTRLLRTGLLCESMLQRGHTITWWTSSFEHQSKRMRAEGGEWTDHRGIRIVALPALGYSQNISVRRYLDHRMVAREFRRAAPAYPPPDLVLASVPCHHLAAAGAAYARYRGIPCAVDLRDLWPDVFGHRLPVWLARIALAGEFHVLGRALRSADALLGISPGYVSLAVRRSRRARRRYDRHFYLGAAPIGAAAALPEPLAAHLSRWSGRKLLVYAGSFGRSYEILLVAEAARRLATRRSDFALVFAGAGDQGAELKHALRDHPAAVEAGWLGAEQLASLLRRAYVGLAPFRAGAPQSVPNKVFDYFAAGVPVVSSLEGEMRVLLESGVLGTSYRPGDCADLMRTLDFVLDRPSLRDDWAKNATRFFAAEGSSERIYPDYCRHLEELVASSRAPAAGGPA